MTATPQAILDLVERFARNVDLCPRPSCNESQARCEFMDPFFEALGWDGCNVQQRSRQSCPLFPQRPTRVQRDEVTDWFGGLGKLVYLHDAAPAHIEALPDLLGSRST